MVNKQSQYPDLGFCNIHTNEISPLILVFNTINNNNNKKEPGFLKETVDFNPRELKEQWGP